MFNQKAPFSDHKKSEFPDAFVLTLLENYARKNGLTITILSADSDMQNYDSYYLYKADYKEFINQKLVVKEKLDGIKDTLNAQYDEICSKIHYDSIIARSLMFYRIIRKPSKLYSFSIRPHNSFTRVSNRSIV